MPDVKVILESMAAAGGLAALILLACGWPWKAPREKLVAVGWALAVGGGFFAGCCVLLGRLPNWPPREDIDRLLLVLVPAAVAAEAIAAVAVRPRWLPWAMRGIVAATAGRILLHNTTYIADLQGETSKWTAAQAWLYLCGMAAGLVVVWMLLARLAIRAPSRAIPLALALACGAAGVTIMLSGYATGGQLGFPLAMALGSVAIASLVSPKLVEMRGGIGVGVVLLFAILVLGRFFGELTTAHAVPLFFAPLLAWAGALPPVKKLRSWQRGLFQLLVVAIPLAFVVAQAQRQFAADSQGKDSTSDPYSGYYK